MRVLFLTNFYRIQASGGEDQSCQQVVEGLKQRGHVTLVLTSMLGMNNVPVEAEGIYRSLYLEMDFVPWRHSLTFFTRRRAREQHNLRCFERVLEQFKPDIVFIWGMWNLPKSLAALAEARYPDNVVYRFATYWPTLPSQHEFYWRAPGRSGFGRLLKKVLSPMALALLAREKPPPPLVFKHAMCVSLATRTGLVKAGIPVAKARVIHTGLDAQRYLNRQRHTPSRPAGQNINLLYAGRLVPEKGIDTVIRALEKLVLDHGLRTVRLSVAGSDSAGYENYLRQLVTQARLDDYVSFLGHVPPEEMSPLLQKFDALLIPSLWAEPFSRMVLEGMLAGLVVVATPSGGTTEILSDGENGLLFAAGDADDLTQKIVLLAADPELRQRLALAGQQTVVDRFTGTRMMDEIEDFLQDIAHGSVDADPLKSMEADLSTSALPTVSVIIPTYNRKDRLGETLQSLAQQTYPHDRFEVLVVDDGSTDGTETITAQTYPYHLRMVRQHNQGDAAARNFGARQSEADVLVFLDDDILLEPGYLTHLIQIHDQRHNRIVVGTWDLWQAQNARLSQSSKILLASGAYFDRSPLAHDSGESVDQPPPAIELPFRDIHSNNMSLRREAYFKIGMMQPLEFSGSSMWCDLEFTYRAYRQNFEFWRSTQAICWHRDRLADNLDEFKKRMRTAAYRSVMLFQKHPNLLVHVPMFHDKTPINWGQDSPQLIARKMARAIASSRPALWSMEQIAKTLEERDPTSGWLPSLYRYIIGGYVFRGYREGLHAFGQPQHPG